MEDVLNSEMR